MKTTLDGVVFLLPHVSGHAKTEFHSRRIFPGPREEGGNGMRRPGESCRTRTVGRQDEAAERGSKMDSRTERQDGAQNKAAEQGGKTDRQDETAGRSSRTEQQDGAAEKEGEGKAGSSQRTGPGAPPAQTKKTGETIGPARFSTGIPTAGSRRTAKKRTEKRPGICKRPMHRFSIRCSDTGKGAILSARPPLVK